MFAKLIRRLTLNRDYAALPFASARIRGGTVAAVQYMGFARCPKAAGNDPGRDCQKHWWEN